MNLQDKIVLAHKGFFNKESEKTYRENSKDVCKVSTQKDYVAIIELDVRKSKDGILYCYHGGLIDYYFYLKIPRKFADIKKKYQVDTLEEVLKVITEDKIICLDLKNSSITKEDILNALKGKKFKEVVIGDTSASVSFMDRFSNMPQGFVKVMNGHIFCNFFDLQKLKDKNYKYFQVVFPFQVNRKIIENASGHGLEFSCAPLFFLSKKNYWKKMDKYNIKHVSSDFI
jgi:hypothetical protein